MTQTKASPAPVAAGNGAHEQGQALGRDATTTSPRQRSFWTKRRRILLALIQRQSLHRFQAEKLGDHCLHSTVSALQGDGLGIARELIQVPGWGGAPTTVARYWLTSEQREAAIDRLARDLRARGLAESREDAVRIIAGGAEAA